MQHGSSRIFAKGGKDVVSTHDFNRGKTGRADVPTVSTVFKSLAKPVKPLKRFGILRFSHFLRLKSWVDSEVSGEDDSCFPIQKLRGYE